MSFLSKRDKRLENKAQRRRKRAARKEVRADKAVSRGKVSRAERLKKNAEELKSKAAINLFWDHAVIEQKRYKATRAQLAELRTALDWARLRAERIEAYLAKFESKPKEEARDFWNDGSLGAVFGSQPKPNHLRKLLRRMRVITNALLRENLYIVLTNTGKRYGRAVSARLNRPFSKNVRIQVDLPYHTANVSKKTARLEEISDTIVHEVTHTLNAPTHHPGDSTLRKALRDPASYGAFFKRFWRGVQTRPGV